MGYVVLMKVHVFCNVLTHETVKFPFSAINLLRRSSMVWASWTTSVWAHFQVSINVCLVLTKPQLWESFSRFVTGKIFRTTPRPSDTRPANNNNTTGGYLVARPDGEYTTSGTTATGNRSGSSLTRDLPVQSRDDFGFIDEAEDKEGTGEEPSCTDSL